jgi:hypothetical protein
MTKSTTKQQYLVIIGINGDDKPRAARFNAADEAAVRKAAQSTALKIARARSDEALKLVRKLPQGKLFASGKGLVPLVKWPLFQELLGALTFDDPQAEPLQPANDQTGERAAGSSPQQTAASAIDPWAAIKVGSVVLACQSNDEGHGWWEAIVIAVPKNNITLTLRWRDYPELKKFAYPRREVGLLAPDATITKQP